MRGLLSREPVRVYLYGIVAAIVALLVGLGVVAEASESLILAVCAAVLSVPAVEKARAKVSPVATTESVELPRASSVKEILAEVEADEAVLEEDQAEGFLDAAIEADSDSNPEPKDFVSG